MDSSPSSVTYVTMDDFGNATPVQEGIRGVPVHTGTPVKYGPLDGGGEDGEEWGLRETRVQVSYLHPDMIESQGAEYLTEPSKANGDNGNGGNANSFDEDIDESSCLLGGQMESQEAEFRRSELGFLAVKTTCAKLLPVDDSGRQIQFTSTNEKTPEAVGYVPVDQCGNVIAPVMTPPVLPSGMGRALSTGVLASGMCLGGGGGAPKPEMLTEEELDYGIAPDSTSTPLRPPEEEYLKDLYALHAQTPHSGKFDGVYEDGLRSSQQRPPQQPPPRPFEHQPQQPSQQFKQRPKPPPKPKQLLIDRSSFPPRSSKVRDDDDSAKKFERNSNIDFVVNPNDNDDVEEDNPDLGIPRNSTTPNNDPNRNQNSSGNDTFLPPTTPSTAHFSTTDPTNVPVNEENDLSQNKLQSSIHSSSQELEQTEQHQQQQPAVNPSVPSPNFSSSNPRYASISRDNPAVLPYPSPVLDSSGTVDRLDAMTPPISGFVAQSSRRRPLPEDDGTHFNPNYGSLKRPAPTHSSQNGYGLAPSAADVKDATSAPLALAESFADMDMDSSRGTPIHAMPSPMDGGVDPRRFPPSRDGVDYRQSPSTATTFPFTPPSTCASPSYATDTRTRAATQSPTTPFNNTTAIHSPTTPFNNTAIHSPTTPFSATTYSPTPPFNAGAALHSPDTQAPDEQSLASSVYSVASSENNRMLFHNPRQPTHHGDHHNHSFASNRNGGAGMNGEATAPRRNGGAAASSTTSTNGRRGGATPPNSLVVNPSRGAREEAEKDDRYRDPTLAEVIDYLSSDDDKLKANAGAYLQHLMFKNEPMKRQVRQAGGIPPLLLCLDSQDSLVRKNSCKALKNLSHKDRQAGSSMELDDSNKVAIFNAGGVSTLATRLKSAPDPQERGLVAAVLWNLSACEEIKPHLLENEEMLSNVIDGIILSRARYNRDVPFNANPIPGLPYPEDLKNSTGILRNLSSAGGRDPETRSRLRQWPGFVDSLVRVVKSAVEDSVDSLDPDTSINFTPINNKVVENAACTLRNLSYRIQEMRDGPDYDEERLAARETADESKSFLTETSPDESRTNSFLLSSTSRSGAMGTSSTLSRSATAGTSMTSPNSSTSKRNFIKTLDATIERRKRKRDETFSSSKIQPVGAELLWHQDTIGLYVSMLESCVNTTTLAAAGGAIQNLCACAWRPSAEIGSLVRRKMGLPMIVDLLQLQDERAVCAMAWALRNLIIQDATNRQLVGKYGVANLAALLPEETPVAEKTSSVKKSKEHLEDTVYAALSTLADVLHKNPNASQQFLEKKGVEKTVSLTRSRGVYTERTLKMAALLLRRLWQIKALQKAYKKRGWSQRDFHVTKLEVARQPEADAFQRRNDTLIRQNKPTESDVGGGRARMRRKRGGGDSEDNSLREADETPV